MSVYYSTECDNIGQHLPSCCGNDELGRIRSIAFVHKSKTFADITSASEWQAAIAAGTVFVIPNTQGSYTPSEKTGTGFGHVATKMMGYEHKISYKDPDYNANNITWYNLLKRSNNYNVYFCTETLGHLSGKQVCVIPKNPVPDDINGKMTIDVDVVWSEEDLLVPHAVPSEIFDCFLTA